MKARLSTSGETAKAIENKFGKKVFAVYFDAIEQIAPPDSLRLPSPLMCSACGEQIASYGGEKGRNAMCGFCHVLLTAPNSPTRQILLRLKKHYRENRAAYKFEPNNPIEGVMS